MEKVKIFVKKHKKILSNIMIYILIVITFLGIDLLMHIFTSQDGKGLDYINLIPVAFVISYSIIMCGLYYSIPKKVYVVIYTVFSVVFLLVTISQTMHFSVFGRLYGMADILYASEANEFFSFILQFVNSKMICAYISILLLIVLTNCIIIKSNKSKNKYVNNYMALLIVVIIFMGIRIVNVKSMGQAVKADEWDMWNRKRNIYNSFSNSNRAYMISGIYEYTFRSIYIFLKEYIIYDNQDATNKIDEFFANSNFENEQNEYTDIFKDKNLIMIMLETIDEWQITEDVMPTLYDIKSSSLDFTNYYAPFFGSGATLNSEFCALTGIHKSNDVTDYTDISQKFYPFSLPNLFKTSGYTVNSVHYNTGFYYNRTNLHQNIGFQKHHALTDDKNVSLNPEFDSNLIKDDYVYNIIAPKQEQKFMTFITTYTPHLPFNNDNKLYSELVDKYGLADRFIVEEDEERTVVNVLSHETDEFFKTLMEKLKEDDLLKDTVIVIYSDHYNYGFSRPEEICKMKNVPEELIYRVPFMIWTEDMESNDITKLVQTNDMLPTLANMFGLEYNAKNYLKADVFSSYHRDLIYFSDYSWYDGKMYSKSEDVMTDEYYITTSQYVNELITVDNAILKTNYYFRK